MFCCGNFRLLCTYVCGQIHDKNMECRRPNKTKNLTINLDWTEEETVCNRCIDKLLKYLTGNDFRLSLIKLDKRNKTLNISWDKKGYN